MSNSFYLWESKENVDVIKSILIWDVFILKYVLVIQCRWVNKLGAWGSATLKGNMGETCSDLMMHSGRTDTNQQLWIIIRHKMNLERPQHVSVKRAELWTHRYGQATWTGVQDHTHISTHHSNTPTHYLFLSHTHTHTSTTPILITTPY